jgi:tRNA/rRNA methyltransferase
MAYFRVVLVSPQNDGNVGAVARSMGNFGFEDLTLVTPCPITEEAYKRAKHGGDVLRNAKTVETLDQAVAGCSLVVGTSGIVTSGDKHFIRIPLTPRELSERVVEHEGTVALLFGQEDSGLSQVDLAKCDVLVHIPASDRYPVLNLSHAVAIVLYEIQLLTRPVPRPKATTEVERDILYGAFDELLVAIRYPDFRREKTSIMFRRMMGRSVPTRWEFYTIMGVIKDAAKRIEALEQATKDKDAKSGK